MLWLSPRGCESALPGRQRASGYQLWGAMCVRGEFSQSLVNFAPSEDALWETGCGSFGAFFSVHVTGTTQNQGHPTCMAPAGEFTHDSVMERWEMAFTGTKILTLVVGHRQWDFCTARTAVHGTLRDIRPHADPSQF